MALQVWLPLNGDLRNLGLSTTIITNNGAAVDNNGKIGKCYSTNGSNLYINCGNYTSGKPNRNISICFWIYPRDISGNKLCAGSQHGSNQRLYFGILDGGYISFGAGGTGWGQSNNCKINANTWYHIALTFNDTGFASMYINSLITQTRNTGTFNFTGNFDLGRGNAGESYRNASFNDFRIYDHCLSEDEIHELSLGKVAHWCLDENSFITKNTAASHINFSNISNYESGYTSISDCEIGGKKIVITNKLSWCGAVLSVPITETGTYTLSVYCKPISRSSTAINLTLYFSGCGYSDNSTAASWSNPGTWQRISLVRNFQQTGTLTIYLICYGGSRNSNYTISAEYCKLLVEKMPEPSNYSLTNTDPVFKDISGNHYDLTVNGNPTLSNDSARYNKSTLFNGSNYLSCTSPTAEAKTLSLWAYIGSIPTSSSVLFADYKSKLSLGFYNSGTLLITRCGGTSATLGTISSLVKTNSWNHFCVVNGATNQLYINGLAATMSGSDYWTHNTDVLMIGNRDYNNGTGFANKISDVRLYATALSADDVLKLYKLGNV